MIDFFMFNESKKLNINRWILTRFSSQFSSNPLAVFSILSSLLTKTHLLEANQNKNNCKFKFPTLFSVLNRWEKSTGDFNLL